MNKYDDGVIKILRFIIIIEIVIIAVLSIIAIINSDKKIYQKNFLEDKKVNEIIPVYPNDELMAKKYFADFVNLALNSPEVAYNYVADYYKEKVYPTYEQFEKNINKDTTEAFKSASIASYKVTEKTDYKVFYIKDTSGHEYLIKENGIMNYKIYLDINNVDIKN